MAILQSRRFGSLHPARLARFERELGGPLPDDYRAFLLEHNGGRPAPPCFRHGHGEFDWRPVLWLYGLHDPPPPDVAEWDDNNSDWLPVAFMRPLDEVLLECRMLQPTRAIGDVVRWRESRRAMVERGLMPVGAVPWAALCYGVAGPERGRVFAAVDAEPLTELAPSFTAFLTMLEPLPDPTDGEWFGWWRPNELRGDRVEEVDYDAMNEWCRQQGAVEDQDGPDVEPVDDIPF